MQLASLSRRNALMFLQGPSKVASFGSSRLKKSILTKDNSMVPYMHMERRNQNEGLF